VLAATILFCSAIAFAACDEDTIDTISPDGDLIVLTSGASYDVDPGDQTTAALWQEGDEVLICGDTIVDKDQGGERVEVTEH
jgi:hypothetical protein